MLLVFVLSVGLVRQVLQDSPVALDESLWVTSGYLTFQLYRDRAPPSRWAAAYDELGLNDWGNKNPPVGKLYVGAIVAAFRKQDEPIRFRWDWTRDHIHNSALGNDPPLRILTPVRLGIAASAAATLFLTYLIAFQICRRKLPALFAPLSLYLATVFEFHATHVYMDLPQLGLMAGSIAAFAGYIHSRRRLLLVTAFVLSGLSCAVKFSSAPIVLGEAAYLALNGLETRRLWRAFAAIVVPCLVFVLVNPYLYSAPIQRTMSIVREWSRSKEVQKHDPILASSAVHSKVEGLRLVTVNSLLHPHLGSGVTSPAVLWIQGIVVLLCLVAMLCAFFVFQRYRVRVRGSRMRMLGAALAGMGCVATELMLRGSAEWPAFLFGVGLFGLVLRSRGEPASALTRSAQFCLGMLLILFLATALWLPFDWPRYYLPVTLLVAVVHSVGLVTISEWFALERRAPSRSEDARRFSLV